MTHAGAEEGFGPEGLRSMLTTFLEVGYRFVGFDDATLPTDACIILRHDVDVDLEAALRVAQIEHHLGICATYFLLLSSDLYNPLSARGRGAVRRLIDLGHSIGLHFDPTVYGGGSDEHLVSHLLRERDQLQVCCSEPIGMFSLHKPAERTDVLRKPAADLQSTYAPQFFDEIGYVADSMGWWRYLHPFQQEFFEQRSKAQMLLHPIWWTRHEHEHPAERLQRLADERRGATLTALAETIAPFDAWLNGRTDDRWVWSDEQRAGL